MYRQCANFSDQSRCVADLAEACELLRARVGYSDPDARSVALCNLRDIARAGQMTLNLLDSWHRGDDLVRTVIPQLVGLQTVTSQSVESAGKILQKTGKLSLLLLGQFQVENALRNICREISPSPVPRKFFTVAKTVIDQLGLPPDRMNALVTPAELRNSLHANGIHQNQAKTITLGMVTYEFTPNQPVRCSDWEHIANALEHSVGVLAEVFLHPRVPALADPIMDQYAWDQATAP